MCFSFFCSSAFDITYKTWICALAFIRAAANPVSLGVTQLTTMHAHAFVHEKKNNCVAHRWNSKQGFHARETVLGALSPYGLSNVPFCIQWLLHHMMMHHISQCQGLDDRVIAASAKGHVKYTPAQQLLLRNCTVVYYSAQSQDCAWKQKPSLMMILAEIAQKITRSDEFCLGHRYDIILFLALYTFSGLTDHYAFRFDRLSRLGVIRVGPLRFDSESS
jgi:hypothetical protein